MNFYDMMRQRAQSERDRRLAQTSMAVTDGIPPQAIMQLQQQGPKMPRMFGGQNNAQPNHASNSDLNDILFKQQQLAPWSRGDYTYTATSLDKAKDLPAAQVRAITEPASVPFFMGGNALPNLPQFADPRVQAMLPSVSDPTRSVGATSGTSTSTPAAASIPLPPRRSEYDVKGYSKGIANAGIGAQEYADQFAGGDLSKIKSRLINIDGEMKNDYYTKGLLDFSPADANAAAPATSQQPDFLERLRMLFSGGGA